MFSVFLPSYRNTSGSLGGLQKAEDKFPCQLNCYNSSSHSPKLSLKFL